MAGSANCTPAPSSGGAVTRAIQAMRKEPEPAPARRGFLRGLLTLPLVGGAASLIGAPSAVAEPVTREMLRKYHDWLMYERFMVALKLDDQRPSGIGPQSVFGHAWRWHRARGKIRECDRGREMLGDGVSIPSTRAALMLSAIGCD